MRNSKSKIRDNFLILRVRNSVLEVLREGKVKTKDLVSHRLKFLYTIASSLVSN